MLRDSKSISFSQQQRQPLPFLQKKKIGADSYVSERLKRIRKQRAKQMKQLRLIQQEDKIMQSKTIKWKQVDQIKQLKKNFIVSSNKIVSSDQLLSSFQPFRKQLQLLRRRPSATINYQQLMSNLHPFTNAIRQLDLKKQQKQHKSLIKSIDSSPASVKLYKSIPKKKGVINRNSTTKPISQSRINYQEVYFLNVGKISLLDAQEKKFKKISEVYHSSFGEKRSNLYQSQLQEQQEQNLKLEQQNIEYRARVNFLKSKPKPEKQLPQNPQKLPKPNDQSSQSSQPQKQPQVPQCYPSQKQPQPKRQPAQNPPKKSKGKKLINIPFETYYYRTFIWKINYTNLINVEIPQQYQHRLRVYIGKGNNSGLVRGLIKRRIWFAVTDKIEEANFVWTQLKSLPFFKLQQGSTSAIGSNQSQLASQKYKCSFLTKDDQKQMAKYIQNYYQSQQRTDQRLLARTKYFSSKFNRMIKINDIKLTRMQNHLINNYVIGNKKALFHTMSGYYSQKKQDVFNYLPLTFHIKQGLEDQSYFKFLKYYHSRAKQIKASNSKCKNIWIVKPGENSNRGNGINVCLNLEEIKAILKKKQIYADGTYRTYIVQSYIEKPLLYNKRKFDLRHYMMISCVNGIVKGYWYKDGYVRTTSTQYSLGTNSSKIHLTNDAVQKNLPEYGKYEKGNKLSYDDLQNYIQKITVKRNQPISFRQNILPQMKKIATDAIRACSGTIDPERRYNNFQVFGLDFMIDSDFKLYLIEINSNPCLQLSCPLLGAIIPKMVQNTLQYKVQQYRMTLDTQFPPPVRYYPKGMHYFKNLQQQSRYELVYDSRYEHIYKCSMDAIDQKLLEEEDDTFQDDGEEFDPED